MSGSASTGADRGAGADRVAEGDGRAGADEGAGVLATEDGLELARSLDESLAKILETESLLAATEADRPLSAETLGVIDDLGVGGAAISEEAGGLGLTLGDRVRIAAVLGRRLVPASVRDQAFGVAPLAVALTAPGGTGTESHGLTGDEPGGVALAGPLVPLGAGGGHDPGDHSPGPLLASLPRGAALVAVLGRDRAALYRAPDPGGSADSADAVSDTSGITVQPIRALDAGQGLCRLTLTERAEPLGVVEGAPAQALRRDYTLMLLSEALGAGERTLEVSAEYADQRQQFGRSISSFQAVAHLLAEMALALETARAGISRYVTLAATGDTSSGLDDLLGVLALTVPEAARRACEGAIQVHGGIGFSWELGLHLYYRRVLAIQYLLGDRGSLAERAGAAYIERRRSVER